MTCNPLAYGCLINPYLGGNLRLGPPQFPRQPDSVLALAVSHNNVRSQGTRNIVTAMEETGVSRLVSLSSMGIGDSRHMLPKFYKYFLVPMLLRQGFADHELQERFVRDCEIDWVIVRPGAYTNGSKTGEYRHGLSDTGEKLKTKVSRADVADFMITQLTDETYLRQSLWISY